MNKTLYKPLSWVVGALGGVLAGQVFKQVWSRVAGEDDAPDATDRDYTWRQVIIAAAVQGAIFGAVKAEWERTQEMLGAITGEAQRLQSNPSLARSIEHRFPYLDPLNHLQVELMRRYRMRKADDPSTERVKRGIHLSINGIAAGLRNTG